MKTTTPNPIDVVERAYDLEMAPAEWLGTLMKSVSPLLDGGLGVFAYYYDLATPPPVWFASMIALDVRGDTAAIVQEMLAAYGDTANHDHVSRAHVIPSALETISEACKAIGIGDLRQDPIYTAFLVRLEAGDMMSLRTIEPGGRGIAVCAPQRDERVIDRRTKNLWARVAAHVAAGRRLRGRLADEPFEAVLTPGGKLEHAEGDSKSPSMREALRTAVLRQEKARGKTRRDDPEAATDMWPALVSGRWSLVDHFERGGRRYIVARRNEHSGSDPRALGDRERAVAQLAALGKSNKLIAYELGVSESTVGSHLSSAMRKLGVTTRVELLRLLMQMAQPSP